jgi:hypothetical protein
VNGSSADLDRFQDWGLDAARWAKHAQFLKRSADLMWAPIDRAYDSLSDSVESNQAFEAGAFEDLKHSYGYLLLVGAAVETMLKGQRAGLTALSADEVQHLERLEEYIVWAGRYPARKEFVEPEAESRMIYESSSWDHDRFGRLFEAAQETYRVEAAKAAPQGKG